jgi:hypothetical protein
VGIRSVRNEFVGEFDATAVGRNDGGPAVQNATKKVKVRTERLTESESKSDS